MTHESFQSAGRNREYYWPCVNQHSNLWSFHWFFFLHWLVSFCAYSDWYSGEYLKRPSAGSVSVQIAPLFFSPQAFISVSLTLGLCWNLSAFLSALQFALFQGSKLESCATYLICFNSVRDCSLSLSDIQWLTNCCFMIFSSFVNCCKCQGWFCPCYSILIESGSQKILIFSSLIIFCAIRYTTRYVRITYTEKNWVLIPGAYSLCGMTSRYVGLFILLLLSSIHSLSS